MLLGLLVAREAAPTVPSQQELAERAVLYACVGEAPARGRRCPAPEHALIKASTIMPPYEPVAPGATHATDPSYARGHRREIPGAFALAGNTTRPTRGALVASGFVRRSHCFLYHRSTLLDVFVSVYFKGGRVFLEHKHPARDGAAQARALLTPTFVAGGCRVQWGRASLRRRR